MCWRSPTKWRLSFMEGRQERAEPLDRAHDLSSLGGEVEAVARGDRSMQQCPWCLASPSLGERQVAEGLLDRAARQRMLRPGMVVLADKGLAGREFAQTVADLGAVLVRPDRADK